MKSEALEEKRTYKKRGKGLPAQCPRCLTRALALRVVPHNAEVAHDGRLYQIHIPSLTVPVCTACGEKVFTNEVDDQISAALRAHLKLLSPEKIRTQREHLGLQQRELAERLGVPETTIAAWESGALVQSKAMDNLLNVYFAFPEVQQALSA